MDGHAGIPPSYSGLSQYPRANPFGDESSNRATMPPPTGSSLPPFSLLLHIPQPFQFGSQNFIPAGSSPSQWMLSQVPHTMLESSSVGSGSSQPASVFSGLFNADQLSKIAASDELKEMAESDPKHLKITLSNRESAARSKAKKALHESELEDKVETLETQIDILTAELKLEKRGRMTADDECVQFRIRLHAGEAHARLREDLIQQLNGEVRRLIEEASVQREEMSRLREEVSEYRRRESERMNANMLDQLNINQQFQEKPQQTNYNFE
ncbi:transcription factor VIP1-like [Brassica rapa]|nr:transcription factor VIP1-like [Brassica rapa]